MPYIITSSKKRFVHSIVSKRRIFTRKGKLSDLNVKNRLGGPEGVGATGPRLDTNDNIQWFPEFNAAFAISIRPLRWNGMQARLSKWAPHVRLWEGTNGEHLNIKHWIKQGKAAYGCRLNRGQLGCYDSHVRVWEYIVKQNLQTTLILEDDANIRYTHATYKSIRDGLDEAKQLNIQWDLFYLGRSRLDIHTKYSSKLVKPKGCCGLFAYVLTLKGAKLLLEHSKPYRIPVDVLVANLHDSNRLNAVGLEPRLCYVVPVRSDTRGIK
jgi:glycosyl transferase family 25